MKIHHLLTTGKSHYGNGEDFQFYTILKERWLIAAVMDGCTSGQESIFPAIAYAKSLGKASRLLPNMTEIFPELDLDSMDKEAVGNFYLKHLFEDIKKLKKLFYLDVEELLSTIILMVFDIENNSAWVNISGDGIITCNGNINHIDQENIPDFMGYHLDKKFGEWLDYHTEGFLYENVHDIAISTDGIQKLKKEETATSEQLDIMDYFLIQSLEPNMKVSMETRYQELVQNERFIPYDDISIIRVIV